MKSASDEAAAAEARQALYSEQYPWLRTRQARRGLVVLAAVGIIGSTGARLLDWPFLGLLFITALLGAWIGLRIAVRKIVDLPDQFLDERMLARRGEVFQQAYIATGGLVSALAIAHIVTSLLAKFQGWPAMSGDTWFELSFTVIFVMMVLPSSLYAWTEREI